MNMHIRPLTPADHPAWSDLLATSFDRSPIQMTALLCHLQRSGLVAWGGMGRSHRPFGRPIQLSPRRFAPATS